MSTARGGRRSGSDAQAAPRAGAHAAQGARGGGGGGRAAAQTADPARLGGGRRRRDHRRDPGRHERRRLEDAAPADGQQRNTPAVKEVTALLDGIPQKGNVLGSPTAPATLVYFGDLECPICKEFTLGALPTLIQKYVRTGKLKIEYRNLRDGDARTGNVQNTADRSAGGGQAEQGLVLHRAVLPPAGPGGHGIRHREISADPGPAGAGPEPRDVDRRPRRPRIHERDHDRRAGRQQRRLHGTPSFQIGKSGGAVQKLEYSSLKDPSGFESAIDKVLKS